METAKSERKGPVIINTGKDKAANRIILSNLIKLL